VKQQLYAEATPDKDILKRIYGSISKLLGSAASEATAAIEEVASPEKTTDESAKKLASTTGGYRLRKSRKAQYMSKKKTLRRSRRL
jgi:hypothetical protein